MRAGTKTNAVPCEGVTLLQSVVVGNLRLRDYNVGYKQMLVRSPHGTDDPMNLDILFVGADIRISPPRLT